MIMWKVRFDKDNYKTVEKFNDKATVVEITGCLRLPSKIIQNIPSDVYSWMVYHSNPRVGINLNSEYILIKAKGKAVRLDEDEDNPVLAEKIAECRAKMKMYDFVARAFCKYINYYVELMVGKRGEMLPLKTQGSCLCKAHEKFNELCDREYRHLIKLLEETGKWD